MYDMMTCHPLYTDLVPGVVGSLHLAVPAELGQDLRGLHGVPPLVVAAGVVLGRQPAGGPVSAVEPVLQVYLGLPYQVVRAKQVPVKHLQGQQGVLGETGLELETPGMVTC